MPNSARWTALIAVAVFGISFGIYVATLAPTITWRNEGVDSGDLATAVHTLGVAHPPGYPTYVVLGWLFHWLPFGDAAYRLNLMSAFWAAASAALVYLTVLNLLRLLRPGRRQNAFGYLAAVTAALSLAFSSVFWSQATIAEVYALNAFFVAAIYFLLTRRLTLAAEGGVPSTSKGGFHLLLAAGLFGLGMGNHVTLAWLAPVVLLLAAARRPPWRQCLLALVFLVAGLGIYVYLPWAASRNPPINWGYATTWPHFSWLVSGELYRRFAFGLPLEHLPQRLLSWLQLVGAQLQLPGLLLGMVGVARLWSRRRLVAVSGLLLLVATSLYSVMYDTTDSYLYLIPAFIVLAIWLGFGLYFAIEAVADWLNRRGGAWRRAILVLWLAPLLLPATSLSLNYSARDLSSDWTAYSYARDAFSSVEPDAIVVADSDDHVFALTYYRYVEDSPSNAVVIIKGLLGYAWYQDNLRRLHPDLTVAPDMGDYRLQLLALVYDNRSRPIYMTSADALLSGRFQWLPWGPLLRLAPQSQG